MKLTGNYRQGIERYLPSPAEALLLLALVFFTFPLKFRGLEDPLFGTQGTGNQAIAGLSTAVIVIAAWVLGVALRAATNQMRWWLLVGAVLMLLVPWLARNTFQLSLMAQVCVFAMMIFGLNIVTGLTGQISLGHGALVGLSAYITAILMHNYDWPLFGAMPVGILTTTAFGFLLGIPALRLTGPYLAVATIAAALIFPLILKLDSLDEYTHGVQGIREEKLSPPGSVEDFFIDTAPGDAYRNDARKTQFAEESWIYYIAAGAAFIGMFAAWNLARSRFGRAFIAVRDSEVAATSMGINVALYKVTAFGISALYAGITGALYFMVISFVSPESFDLVNLSINPLAYMVIGGLATTGGSVVGAFGYMWVPQFVKQIATINQQFDLLQGALTGLLLILIMTRLPQGVWGATLRLNRFTWPALGSELARWATTRSLSYWLGIAAGAVLVLAIGMWLGGFWGVFTLVILLVAPRDLYTGLAGNVRKAVPAQSRHESAKADAT